jgi:hypothetical protein
MSSVIEKRSCLHWGFVGQERLSGQGDALSVEISGDGPQFAVVPSTSLFLNVLITGAA